MSSERASDTSGDIKRIAFTPGEPAGIGPDLAALIAHSERDYELVVVANRALIELRAQILGQPLPTRTFDPAAKAQGDSTGQLCVLDIPLGQPVTAGVLATENADYVLNCLTSAVEHCQNNICAAMVTGPVHKGVINDAGRAFSGHTEFIAEMTHSTPVMMLAAGDFRVALATTHLPLSDVPAALTRESLERVCRVLHKDLQQRFGIPEPVIVVCGLNPHAGEGGHLGQEEITVIEPVLQKLVSEGMHFCGPLPADTLFTPRHLNDADAALAMFHDQGLPVLKYAGFGSAINITLGLPIIRTSVDHGTALDLAGTGNIETGSIQAAMDLALELADKCQPQTPATHS